MPMSERYYTVDGQMVGYEEGGVRKDFLTDHLGSVIAIMDENEVRVFDTRYSAYGRNRWITGTSCGFGWVGTYGYRETGLSHMSHYVRARHYSYVTGGWSTVDPLWPDESAYGYCHAWSTKAVDPSGRACWVDNGNSTGIYGHAFICMNTPCKGPNDPKPFRSCGFWPSMPDPAGASSISGCLTSTVGSSLLNLLIIALGLGSSGMGSSSASSGGGGVHRGEIRCPDPDDRGGPCRAPEGFHALKCNNDPRFEKALCECINESRKNPPGYCIGSYICGSWVSEMWKCAKKRLGWKDPIGPPWGDPNPRPCRGKTCPVGSHLNTNTCNCEVDIYPY